MKVPTLIRRHKIAAIVAGIVAISCALLALFVLQLATIPGMESCVAQTLQRVQGPGPYDAYVVEKGCDGIVGSDTVYVELAPREGGKRHTILSYERVTSSTALRTQDTYPRVRWLGKSRLRVSVDAASEIEQKRNKVDGIAVEYQIGSVQFK